MLRITLIWTGAAGWTQEIDAMCDICLEAKISIQYQNPIRNQEFILKQIRKNRGWSIGKKVMCSTCKKMVYQKRKGKIWDGKEWVRV